MEAYLKPNSSIATWIGLFYSVKDRILNFSRDYSRIINLKIKIFWHQHQSAIKKILKRTLVCFLSLYVIQITVLAMIDPNQFKPIIEAKILKETGLTLIVKGPMQLSGIKGIVLEAKEIVLKKNPRTKYEMFKAESMEISPRLWTLLLGQLGFKLELQGVQYLSYRVADLKTKIALKPNKVIFTKVNLGLKKGREAARLRIDQIKIDFKEENPKYYLKHTDNDFPLFLLMDILESEALIKGDTKLTLDLTAEGKTLEMLKRSLAGSLEMEVSKGAVIGLDLISSLKDARSVLSTIESKLFHGISDAVNTLLHRKEKKLATPFSKLIFKGKVDKGKLNTNEFFVKHPRYHLKGLGEINFGKNTLRCQVHAFYKEPKKKSQKPNAKIPRKKSSPVPLIIHITGPLEKPDVKPDMHSYFQYVRQSNH